MLTRFDAALAALTAAAFFFAPFAPKAQKGVAYQYTDTQAPLIQALDRAGVPVFMADANECPTGVAGYYDIDGRTITICPGAEPTTLAHEAVHAAQICNDGTLFPPEKVWPLVPDELAGLIRTHYPVPVWAIEAEAYLLEHEDPADVADLVNKACPAR